MGGCCASEADGQTANPGELAKKGTKDGAEMGKGVPKNRKKLYSKNTHLKLGYWKMRGLAQPIRYLLEYTEHPYDEVAYEQGNAPDFSVAEWTKDKGNLGLDFPSLPYLLDMNDGKEVRLTDTYTIMQYLAEKYAPELLGGSAEKSAELDMVYAQLKDVKQSITGPCYVGSDRKTLVEQSKSKMKPLVDYLGKKEYLFGEELTFLDFYMLELCDFVEWLTEGSFYSTNKPLNRYIKRMHN